MLSCIDKHKIVLNGRVFANWFVIARFNNTNNDSVRVKNIFSCTSVQHKMFGIKIKNTVTLHISLTHFSDK